MFSLNGKISITALTLVYENNNNHSKNTNKKIDTYAKIWLAGNKKKQEFDAEKTKKEKCNYSSLPAISEIGISVVSQKKFDNGGMTFAGGEVKRSSVVVVLHVGRHSLSQHLVQSNPISSWSKAQEIPNHLHVKSILQMIKQTRHFSVKSPANWRYFKLLKWWISKEDLIVFITAFTHLFSPFILSRER